MEKLYYYPYLNHNKQKPLNYLLNIYILKTSFGKSLLNHNFFLLIYLILYQKHI